MVTELAGWIEQTFPEGTVQWIQPSKAIVRCGQGKYVVEMIGNGIWCNGKMEVPASSLTY